MRCSSVIDASTRAVHSAVGVGGAVTVGDALVVVVAVGAPLESVLTHPESTRSQTSDTLRKRDTRRVSGCE